MSKLLVHLHLYYQDQTDYFIERLSNITVPFKLIVTLTEDNADVRRKLLSAVPDADILLVENCGYDVYPFFQAMKHIDLSSYDYILKIHTKNSRNKLSLYWFLLVDIRLYIYYLLPYERLGYEDVSHL